MLTTLMRLDLRLLWELSVNDGLRIGIGYPIVLWLLIGTMSVWRMRRTNSSGNELVSTVIFWLAAPLGVVVLSKLNPDLAPNGVPVFGYGFMMFVGFLVAIFSATRRARLVGLNPDVIMDMGMWLLIPGIIGARSFYLMQYHQRVFAQTQGFKDIVVAAVNLPDGGLVFYGGLIAGILGFVAFCFRHRLSVLLMADTIAPSLFIGLGFGRIGCFLYGCCFGDRCDLPWAVRFPADSMPYKALLERGFIAADAPATFALHPSQLYSSASAFVLAGLLAVYFRHRPWNGAVLAVAWILYPINRFVLEFLRGDELGQFNTSLTISQLVSLGLFISGIAYLVWMTTQVQRVHPVRIAGPPIEHGSAIAISQN